VTTALKAVATVPLNASASTDFALGTFIDSGAVIKRGHW
jgi:hypothetical protein